ncbi:MAG: pyridoxamine 5'-phosphate oxidase [Candidatus Dormibacteria bacterium]
MGARARRRPAGSEPPRGGLLEQAVAANPLTQFQSWFADASGLAVLAEAAALATADPSGRPSVRMVLVRTWDEAGFVFYTDTGSLKGHDLRGNPRAALLWYWPALGRQVRVEGRVSGIPAAQVDEYFSSRPRGSQLSALGSRQSRAVASRAELESRVAELRLRYRGRSVPRPHRWQGFRVEPISYEFWQQRPDRLHDRLRYRWAGSRWRLQRLQP